MNHPLLGLAGVAVACVAIAVPASTNLSVRSMTAKHALLQGMAVAASAPREQMVSTLIVKLRDPTAGELVRPMAASRVQALSASAGVKMKSVRGMAGNASLMALDTPLPLSEAKAVAARLAKDPAVAYAEPDIILKKLFTPNDTRFSGPNPWQWNLLAPNANYTGEVGASGSGVVKSAPAAGGANLELAWDLTMGTAAATVAIIDTGIVNHTDLANGGTGAMYVPSGRFLQGYDFVSDNVGAASGLPLNFVANDGNGRDGDPSDPGDWVTTEEEAAHPSICDDGQTGPQNSSWHGSHMSGVAAAMSNNMLGIAGIGWNVRILPVRALGKCGGSLSDIAEAIRWAAGDPIGGVVNLNPANVINLSLGGGSTCGPTIQAAVDFAISRGAVVVAATGNDGSVGTSTPANCNGVIGVTAHTINGDNADYSNVGPGTTISAPGGGTPTLLGTGGPTDDPNWRGYYIPSTVLFGNTDPLSTSSAGQGPGPAFGFFTGTSAATPHVSGVAALIRSRVIDPNVTPAFIKAWLTMRDSVSPHPAAGACVGAIFDCGKGLLNARRALDAADNRTPAVGTPTFLVVAPNTTVSLAGTAAAFPPAAIQTRIWRQLSGPPVTLSNANTNTASFTAPATNNVLRFEFEATDNAMKTGADRVTVRTNSPPVLGQTPAQSATVGQTVSFTVTATDPDGTTPRFSATAIPTGATLSTTGQFTWDTTGVAPGTYQLTYVASDLFSSSAPATVSIALAAAAVTPPGGSPPPTGGGGGGGSVPLWQLLLIAALSLAARVRVNDRTQ